MKIEFTESEIKEVRKALVEWCNEKPSPVSKDVLTALLKLEKAESELH